MTKGASATIVIDQSAVGVSTRSNPATYTGIMDDVRKAFAKANKVTPGLFSFNSKGACETCQGLGVIYTDLAFLAACRRGFSLVGDVILSTIRIDFRGFLHLAGLSEQIPTI